MEDGGVNEQGLIDEGGFVSDGRYTCLPPFYPTEYSEYLQDFDLSEDQSNELLHTLWRIMASFVDLGFGVSSIQHFIPALAEISSDGNLTEVQEGITSKTFNDAVGDFSAEKGFK